MTPTSTWTVTGMTCEHCVRAVTEEVSGIDGVTAVDVDLATGRLTVEGEASEAQIAAAVDEAGYSVTR